MFSSILPSVSSTLKFGQNGSSKQQNRFSVRVFKTQDNAPYPYSMNQPKFLDMGYRPMPHQEQVPHNWYPTNSIPSHYAPPARPAYGIYPNTTSNAYIYEHSLDSKSDLYSTSDFDTLSITTASAFSPAFSTDSTMPLKSPVDERPMEPPRLPRSATPGVRSGYPSAPPMQAPSMSRTPSGRHVSDPYLSGPVPLQMRGAPSYGPPGIPSMASVPQMMPPAGYPIQIPEYDPSTISELEVEERDKLAKINAEYNAASSASYHSTSTASSPELKGSASSGIRRAPSTSPPKATASQQDISSRVSSSQPLHPDLHFPPRRSLRDEIDYSSSSYTKAPLTSSRDGSPPSVERVSSQLPPEDEHLSRTPSQPLDARSTPGFESWSREATINSERVTSAPNSRRSTSTAPVTPLEGRQPSNSPPSSRYSIYAPSPHEVGPSYEQRQVSYPHTTPPTAPRQRKSSLMGGTGGFNPNSRSEAETGIYETPRARSDHREFENRNPDVPLSTPRDYIPSAYPSSSEMRRDYYPSNVVPQGPAIHHHIPASERDSPSSSDSRRDTRQTATRSQDRDRSYDRDEQYQHLSQRPAPPSRRQSYINTQDTAPRSSRDHRSSPEGRENFLNPGPLTSSPKDIKDEPTGLDTVPTPVYADRPYDYNRVRERSISFSKSSRPDLTPTTPTSAHPRQPFSSSRYPSDYEHDSDRERTVERDSHRDRETRRRDRSGTITSERSSPSSSRSSDEGHYQKPYDTATSYNDRREEQRSSYSIPPTPHNQSPTQGYLSREREQERDRPHNHSQRRAATVETASSSSSSSRSPDSLSSRKSMPHDSSRDERNNHLEISTPQPPAYSPPHPELHRRQSDGDKQPYDISNVLPPSITSQYEKRPPSSASSSSTSSTAPFPIPHPPEPHRRYSDGDQNPMPIRPPTSGRTSVPLSRSVRWNENLVAPSPILAPQRRKGWFNRRGDQLWTNDGGYRPPPSGQEYPPDLDEYPDYGEGWMNEECVHIDMSHRLIPKVPLRSALKTCVTKA